MNEYQQIAFIREQCGKHGVFWHHCHDSKRCSGTAGMPDVLIVGVHGLMLRELKTGSGRRSAQQTGWHWTLKAAGINIGIWREREFEDGTVEREIAALARK